MTATTQDGANFILRFRHAPGSGDGTDEIFVVSWMMLAVCAIRHDHLLFHARILEELSLAVFEHADNPVGKSLDVNRFVDRVLAQEERLAEIVADNGDVSAVQIFRLS